MWIGIVVLITFGLCAIACLALSVRGAMQGQWHIFGALLIPALGVGGVIVMLVARPITLELFGDSNLEDLGEGHERIVGDALRELHTGTARFGLGYDDATQVFHWYDEVYAADGGVKGRNDAANTWAGGWDIVADQICVTRAQNTVCHDLFRDGDAYYETNHRREIVNRYLAMPAALTRKDGEALEAGPAEALVRDRTLSGELFLHYGQPFFSATFAGEDGTVAVRRGSDPGNLDAEESGSYAIGEDGMLCVTGVLHVADACFSLKPRVGGVDIVRDDNRVVAAVASIR